MMYSKIADNAYMIIFLALLWTVVSLVDPEAKQKRHDEVFPEEIKKAFEMGKALV